MFEFEGKIRYSETGADLHLTIPGLLNYFQDAAIFEGENISVSMEELEAKHMTWVLNSWQVSWNRRPKVNEDIVVSTVPFAFKGVTGSRNFMMKNKQTEEVLATATSVWVLVDTDNMMPVRPSKELIVRYPIGAQLDIPYEGRRVACQGEGVAREALVIRKIQIDSNHHVNNAEYVNMALDYIEHGRKVNQVRAEYKKSAVLDDVLIPMIFEGEDRLVVRFDSETGEIFALVEFRYG